MGNGLKNAAKYYTKAVLLKRNLHTHAHAPRAPRFFFIRRRRRRRVLTPQPFLRIGNNGIGLLLHLRWCAARLNFEDGTCHHGDEMRTLAIACCSPPQNSCEHFVALLGRVIQRQQQHSSRIAL